jgi:hypothetical protein
MTNRQLPSPFEIAGDVAGALVALNIVVFAAFPLALPLIVLTTVAALPLLVVPVLLAAVAAPVLLLLRFGSWTVRAVRRRATGTSVAEARTADRTGQVTQIPLRPESSDTIDKRAAA